MRTSSRKARLVLDHIRGRTVPEARTVLAFSTRAAATDIEKVLRSAVANAEANHGLDGDDLVVEVAYADEGPTLKRWKPRARGRVNRIRKRTCHVTLVLAEQSGDCDAASTPAPAQMRRPRPPPRLPRARLPPRSRRLRGDERRRRPSRNGPESASRRVPRRRHPRLEVQLVDESAGVRGLSARGRQDPSRTSSASSRMRGSRTS